MPIKIAVLGSGMAGLYFAQAAADYAIVDIITKSTVSQSNSNYAQGGIAAVLNNQVDDFKQHWRDTMIAGAGINNKPAVTVLVNEAPRHIAQLLKFGVPFNQTNQRLDLTREGGHSQRRIAHVDDLTGRAVERVLINQAKQHPNINIYTNCFVVDVCLNKTKQQVIGVSVLHKKNQTISFKPYDIVVLATGGCGQVYQYTTNPQVATGDGLAVASRAGAVLKGMEFVQFHPTVLNLPGRPKFLLSESLRGEGALLRNYQKKTFMSKYDKRKELAPRDIVSRAIVAELKSGPVYLDLRHKTKAYLQQRFPNIYQRLKKYGLNLERDLIPIVPAAHYLCGGVNTDLFGQTNINNLLAIGEVAHTGVHGANRLASNSTMECLVFAARAAKYIKARLSLYGKNKKNTYAGLPIHAKLLNKSTQAELRIIRKTLRRIMWQSGGIVRSKAGLRNGIIEIESIRKKLLDMKKNYNSEYWHETVNMAEVALAILQAAQERSSSVGAHYLT